MLTRREREVASLIALGHTTAEIARLLRRSPRTVETHRKHIAATLGMRRRAEVVRFALDEGLLNPSPLKSETPAPPATRAADRRTLFKICPRCRAKWDSRARLLSDPAVRLIGFQLAADDDRPGGCQSGVFVFSHETCGTSMALGLGEMDLSRGAVPILSRSACSTGQVSNHCLRVRGGERTCPTECICEFVWSLTRLIHHWPKHPSSAPRR